MDEGTEELQWASIGEYAEVNDAMAAAGLIQRRAILTRLSPGGRSGAYVLLVPADQADFARDALGPPVSDAELAAQALESPPPDDYVSPATPSSAGGSAPPRPSPGGSTSHLMRLLNGLRGIRDSRNR
jgi:hypothetical protein